MQVNALLNKILSFCNHMDDLFSIFGKNWQLNAFMLQDLKMRLHKSPKLTSCFCSFLKIRKGNKYLSKYSTVQQSLSL